MAAADAREILIAGGGIGGLAAALALVREGRAVRVLEDAASYPAPPRPWAIAVAAFFMTEANSSSCAARTDGRTTPMPDAARGQAARRAGAARSADDGHRHPGRYRRDPARDVPADPLPDSGVRRGASG
jgi:2-polyprenyl-6-methoxyphenol hydroxylase-like FAD-dependent oxidoreductase